MGTLTITASGFANTPATAPANWPVAITFPASQPANGTKTYTISDADWQAILTWMAATNSPTDTPLATDLLLAWLQVLLVLPTIRGVQKYSTPAPVVPAPISVT